MEARLNSYTAKQAVGTRISVCAKSSTIATPVVLAVYVKHLNIVLKIKVKM